MFQGFEFQQAVVVAGTEKIRNFAGALAFMQEYLQHFKKQNHGTYLPTTPGSLGLCEPMFVCQ